MWHLQVKFPDQYPGNPYHFNDIHAAVCFMLHGMTTQMQQVPTVPPTAPPMKLAAISTTAENTSSSDTIAQAVTTALNVQNKQNVTRPQCTTSQLMMVVLPATYQVPHH